jgi:hypothetical protein
MAITVIRVASNYVGLSTDTKPTAPAGSRFYETDTGHLYVSDGSAWSKVRESWPLS